MSRVNDNIIIWVAPHRRISSSRFGGPYRLRHQASRTSDVTVLSIFTVSCTLDKYHCHQAS